MVGESRDLDCLARRLDITDDESSGRTGQQGKDEDNASADHISNTLAKKLVEKACF